MQYKQDKNQYGKTYIAKIKTQQETVKMPKKTKTVKTSAKKQSAQKTEVKKLKAIKDPYSKSQLLQHIAENAELNKKKVAEVFALLENVINAHLCKNGAGVFTLTGIAKFKTKRMPAQKTRKGRNPFTGEDVMLKAKPARNVVKVRVLKKLKDSVA